MVEMVGPFSYHVLFQVISNAYIALLTYTYMDTMRLNEPEGKSLPTCISQRLSLSLYCFSYGVSPSICPEGQAISVACYVVTGPRESASLRSCCPEKCGRERNMGLGGWYIISSVILKFLERKCLPLPRAR